MTAPYPVASVQAAPVFLDRAATLSKVTRLLEEAAKAGARLVLFPECFLPAYPFWVWFVPSGRSQVLRRLYACLLDQSITVPGPETDLLCAAARRSKVDLAIGVNERNDEASGTTLYNTLLLIDAGGSIRGRHRKLVPTGGERLVHAQGDGSGLQVHQMSAGRVGGLICWENYMPLARYALYARGVQIYLAPTWDRGEPWLSTLRHIAKEGRAYVLGSCSVLRKSEIPEAYAFLEEYLAGVGDWINPGDSAVVDPDGKLLAGPAHEREEILYAEVDPAVLGGTRGQLDVAGHYARPDIFQLTVRTTRPAMLRHHHDEAPPFPTSGRPAAGRRDPP